MRNGVVAYLSLLVLVACGGNGTRTTTSVGSNVPIISQSSGVALVRVLNGASETSAALSYAALTIAGRSMSPVPFGTVSAYLPYSGNAVGAFTVQSAAWQTPLSCASQVPLHQGSYYTLVVTGNSTRVGNQGLQCQLFAEPYTPVAGQSVLILVHHASPALFASGESAFNFGTYAPQAQTQTASALSPTLVTATFDNTLAQSMASGTTQATTVTTTPNVPVGFYIVGIPTPTPVPAATATASPTPVPTTTPPNGSTPSPAPTATSSSTASPAPTITPQATFLPSQAILAPGFVMNSGAIPDSQNLLPFGGVNTVSIYVIDAPPASTSSFVIVGVFD